ncbi:isochorismatase family cysteine hydrolase [Ligilactobacillus agilis]|uniref:cysteine hydrolase family protein n=1 Tax=Ligilactobacillus agilis TaxID=1601 RepID=UPI0025A321D2|nr:isochorismatase family cysteine hydrolase [Ligilactobacillus agilis]MDM8280020.1 isochorismatase family cysteine hydrolase [Ligilactobacillus agilis]
MPKALLIIDYTNDFVATNGALTCGQVAQDLVPTIIDLADSFLAAGDYVILPTDCHHLNDPYHPENKLFPPHNIEETWGQEFYGPLNDWYQAHQDSENVYAFAKNRYSSFQNTNLDNYLRSRQITDLTLSGVCTDICVLHTAVSAYNLNYQLTIPKKAVASFDANGHDWALNHFKTCLGAKLI